VYLSKLVLNVRDPAARRDLLNPYEFHSTLCRAFEAPQDARILWRLERTRPPVILVQSLHPPAFDRIDGYDDYFLEPPETKRIPLTERIRPGQVLRFRLDANPTVTRRGKRHGLRRIEDQLAWLHRQARRAGFEVLGATVTRTERLRFRKRNQDRFIVLVMARFDGYLRVVDPTRFCEAVARGIGHGKALGMGLLTVAPAGGGCVVPTHVGMNRPTP